MLLSLGDADDIRPKAAEHGIGTVLLHHDLELPRSLGVSGTPGALVVDADGRIAEEPALGAVSVAQILAVSSAVSRSKAVHTPTEGT